MSASLGRLVGFFKNFILTGKTAATFLEISRKHVFTASNSNITKNSVEMKKLEQILPKCYSFIVQTLICISNFA